MSVTITIQKRDQPDLIIVSSYKKSQVIENLQKIVPTVAMKWGEPALNQLHHIADLTEKKKWRMIGLHSMMHK